MRRDRALLVAQTRDLVQKLTALADRYEALPVSGQPARARERAVSITLMRLVAASGTRLVDAPAPAAPERSARAHPAPSRGDACARDVAATSRDDAAERRDQRALGRDRASREPDADLDPGFADRYLSANDRDDAAGDRAAALDDRRAAQREREGRSANAPPQQENADLRRLLEQLSARSTFHQAQGLLMARSGMNASEAFEALLLDAQQRETSMTEAATRLVRELMTTGTSELLQGPRRGDS